MKSKIDKWWHENWPVLYSFKMLPFNILVDFFIVYWLKHELNLLTMTSAVHLVDTKRNSRNWPDLLWVVNLLHDMNDSELRYY